MVVQESVSPTGPSFLPYSKLCKRETTPVVSPNFFQLSVPTAPKSSQLCGRSQQLSTSWSNAREAEAELPCLSRTSPACWAARLKFQAREFPPAVYQPQLRLIVHQ